MKGRQSLSEQQWATLEWGSPYSSGGFLAAGLDRQAQSSYQPVTHKVSLTALSLDCMDLSSPQIWTLLGSRPGSLTWISPLALRSYLCLCFPWCLNLSGVFLWILSVPLLLGTLHPLSSWW